jgi:hypothetical protein
MCSNKLAVLAFALLAAVPAFAQRTVVSGTVTDSNGLPYSQGSLTVTLSLPTGALGAYLNGAQIAGTVGPVQLDATGSFLVQLADNTVIQCANAAGQLVTCAPQTQWSFAVTLSPGIPPPQGSGPQTCKATLTVSGSSQSVSPSFAACPVLTKGGINLNANAIPGSPGFNSVPVTSGLLAEYRMLPSENCASIVDYSGNNNNAVGTVGTAPTIIALTGGCTFLRNGAISLPSVLNSALTVQLFFTSGTIANPTGFSGCLICGGGALANSIGLFLMNGTFNGTGTLPGTNFLRPLSAHLSGTVGAQSHTTVAANAPQSIAWTLDTADHIYMGQTESALYYAQTVSSAGAQTVGNFQLGGRSDALFGDVVSWFNGMIYYAVFYNRVLTAVEISQNAQFMQAAMTKRGVNTSIVNTAGAVFVSNQFVGDGDSITSGPQTTNTGYPELLTLNGTWNVSNNGQSAVNMSTFGGSNGLYSAASQAVDPLFLPQSTGNVVAIWAGTNDNSPNAEAGLQGYCNQRRVFGWKCFVITMISRNGEDAFKNTYDTWMRQNWTQFADGLIDIAADPNLGADNAFASANFFIQAAGIHPLQSSIYNIEVPAVQRVINRYYGNRDFSSATTYSSAAAAAVATTAGSESVNTVTITFAATPANCQVGNSIVIAGTTPAGYSNATAGNPVSWKIITRSGTQVTYFTNTTGLGAITVQGTGVCSQRQDADQYAILNFGAGNHTLDSCVGYTGSNLYTKNINAVASTIVPFGSETIDGAASLTITQNQVRILQSQLVSSSAAGCTWKVLQ